MPYRRKLIEVALPLEAINKESAREKSIRYGHPSTLHLWWARRPLAACRAVLWSSLVDDPSEYMPDEASANEERERLFKILEDLVLWENINNEEVLDKARLEIARSVARDLGVDVPVGKKAIREFLATKAPPLLDPFAGGGSIPLEAQRLGLRAYASDLNPVAVLINKALIEIPPKFAGLPPIHPPENGDGKKIQKDMWDRKWKGAEGLAEDVRYYGKWMRNEAFKRIGHLYPKAKITEEILAERPDLKAQGLKSGDELTVIAWLWARTVKCPNPACGAQMPLIRSFELYTKKGKRAYLEPNINTVHKPSTIDFVVKVGDGKPLSPPKTGRGAQFKCLACEQMASDVYLKNEGKAGRMGVQLLTIVADSKVGRIYMPSEKQHTNIASSEINEWKPDYPLSPDTRAIWCPLYGLDTFDKLFTPRQLTTLNVLTEIIIDVRAKINIDLFNHLQSYELTTYSDAIVTYLAEGVSKFATFTNTLAYWRSKEGKSASGFGRQGLAMTWDFTEINPFAGAGGDFGEIVSQSSPRVIENALPAYPSGVTNKDDAILAVARFAQSMVSTDPPYYDNVGYADMSDYFYIWLRKSLANIYPDLFNTVLVPKAQELVASAYRFDGDKEKAKDYFENGLFKVFSSIQSHSDLSYPVTVYYAFKQTEDEQEEDEANEVDTSRFSTGWETMLEGLLSSGFKITGTWPIRTENPTRAIATGSGGVNALASSIVLVCRPRPDDVSSITRREFLTALKKDLAPALRQLQLGNIAPVDFAQAAIGPGMAVFSRYAAVLEADGTPMRVRAALAIINQALDEFLSEQEGEYDSDTRWALAWYEQFGHNEAAYGVAETLSKAKNTSVDGLVQAGIMEARGGKVRLLRRDELNTDWDPEKDKRLTAWESVQHLIYALDQKGEEDAAALLSHLGSLSETARDLAYRLYTVCERKGWAQDALAYNMLVVAWPRLKELASRQVPKQEKLM